MAKDLSGLTIEELNGNINRLEIELAQYENKEIPPTMRIAVNSMKEELKGYVIELNRRKLGGFDSDATSYGRPQVRGGLENSVRKPFKPTPQGMNSKDDIANDLEVARLEMAGKTHHSLNIFDALRTMGYSEADIQIYCKENKLKYEPPKGYNNPVRPNNTIKRIWD